ncbi:PREDICTED: uncharacterized protein LOC105565400 [Vollenhovia emeryi]|uniref:uncharacterized protein LOC105565400 n=1 Tax=Vollenhovia emeryi TaxID=411798 RepID=UPI0005F3E089|nr:PREDICTED: uncharacterized protein LOC105565400 [Vollenhovia emeryi]
MYSPKLNLARYPDGEFYIIATFHISGKLQLTCALYVTHTIYYLLQSVLLWQCNSYVTVFAGKYVTCNLLMILWTQMTDTVIEKSKSTMRLSSDKADVNVNSSEKSYENNVITT